MPDADCTYCYGFGICLDGRHCPVCQPAAPPPKLWRCPACKGKRGKASCKTCGGKGKVPL